MKSAILFVLSVLTCLVYYKTKAQFNLSGQLRTRTEFRNGQGSPLPQNSPPAFFTSQRTRITATYHTYRLKMGIAVQDVRVWGQDASSINRITTQENNGILVHEAWAEIGISDTLQKKQVVSIKIGRQEILYDDQRLLGNLDWLQQGRRHDAAVLQFYTGDWKIHSGFAYNQNRENTSGTGYNPVSQSGYPGNTNGGMAYKSFGYAHINKKYKRGNASFLLFADQFNRYHTRMENNVPVKIWDRGTWNRFTTGLYTFNTFGKTVVNAAAYYQGGKTSAGENLSAGFLSVNTLYRFSEKYNAGAGVDYTTGGRKGNINRAFDPLYGTPHKFWGLMDYFYAGSEFGGKGLTDYYVKTVYKVSPKLQVNTDLHRFASSSDVRDNNDNTFSRTFGTEIDLVGTYSLSKWVGLELGYGHFFSTPALSSESVKNIPGARRSNNWAYLMVKIQPDLVLK